MIISHIITIVFMLLGFCCFLISAIGVFRLKDFYCRLHAASVCESAGLFLCSLGLLFYGGFNITSIKIFVIFMAIFITSPIGTHIITKVAYREKFDIEREE